MSCQDGSRVEIPEARDALVLILLKNAVSALIPAKQTRVLAHVKGKGGTAGAVKQIQAALPHYEYGGVSDVKG